MMAYCRVKVFFAVHGTGFIARFPDAVRPHQNDVTLLKPFPDVWQIMKIAIDTEGHSLTAQIFEFILSAAIDYSRVVTSSYPSKPPRIFLPRS